MSVKVSVIIPIYNAEKYLHKCMDSVLGQSLQNIEVICVDDCSKDSGPEIIAGYMKSDPRVIFVQNSGNMHAGICRNIGLTQAKGEYVLFMDADDWLSDGSLEKLYEEAAAKSADIIRCRNLDYDNVSGKTSTGVHNYLKRIPLPLFSRSLNYRQVYPLFPRITAAPWGGLFRRAFLMDKGIRFNDLLCVNDRSFFWESIIKAETIVFSRTVLINYRMNMGSSLVGNRVRNYDCHFKSYELIYEHSKQLPLPMRRSILNGEMLDMVNWLEGSYGTELYETNKQKLNQFIRTMDISPWRKLDSSKWYRRLHKSERER